jgi:hypothetical protein
MSVNNNQLEQETNADTPISEAENTEAPEQVIQGVASYTPEGDDVDSDNVSIQGEDNLPTIPNTSKAYTVSPLQMANYKRGHTARIGRRRRGGKSTRKRKHANARKTRRQLKQNRKTKRQRK